MQCSQRLTVVATGRLSSLMFFSLIFFLCRRHGLRENWQETSYIYIYIYKLIQIVYIYIYICIYIFQGTSHGFL